MLRGLYNYSARNFNTSLLKQSPVVARFLQSSKNEDTFARYKEKLEQKAQQVGASDINDLQAKLKHQIDTHKQTFDKIDPLKELEEYEIKMAEEHKAKKATEKKARGPRSAEVPEKPFKTLESFVDVNKISQLTKQEVEFIWRARFLGKEGAMHAVAPTRIFKRMYDNARKHAMFILPLPKDNSDGVEMHFVQWAFVGPHTAHCMITTVAEYKLHKEYARPHTTLMFHSELSELQGLVLMNGAVEKESSITLPEAQLLVLNVQRFYGALEDSPANQRRLKLLADFSSGSPDFTVEELIIEAAAMEN